MSTSANKLDINKVKDGDYCWALLKDVSAEERDIPVIVQCFVLSDGRGNKPRRHWFLCGNEQDLYDADITPISKIRRPRVR